MTEKEIKELLESDFEDCLEVNPRDNLGIFIFTWGILVYSN